MPDTSSALTVPFHFRAANSYSTNASGALSFMFLPNGVCTLYDGSVAGSAVTFAGGTVGISFTPLKYRIVSAGIRVHCTSSAYTTAGTMHIRSFSLDTNTSLTLVDAFTFKSCESRDIALKDVHDVVAIPVRTAQPRTNFYDTSSDSAISIGSQQANGVNGVMVSVFGAPASTATLYVEVVVNYELMFSDSDPVGTLATKPPPANPILTAASSKVSSTIGSIFDKGLSSFADAVVRKAGSAVAGYFSGPVAAAVPYLIDVN